MRSCDNFTRLTIGTICSVFSVQMQGFVRFWYAYRFKSRNLFNGFLLPYLILTGNETRLHFSIVQFRWKVDKLCCARRKIHFTHNRDLNLNQQIVGVQSKCPKRFNSLNTVTGKLVIYANVNANVYDYYPYFWIFRVNDPLHTLFHKVKYCWNWLVEEYGNRYNFEFSPHNSTLWQI